MCLIPDGSKVTRDMTFDHIDHDSCKQIGQKLEFQSARGMRAYPSKNVVFYTVIPYKKGQVMSRLFQFLLADLGIHFSSSEYPEKLMSKRSGEEGWGGGTMFVASFPGFPG